MTPQTARITFSQSPLLLLCGLSSLLAFPHSSLLRPRLVRLCGLLYTVLA